MKINWASLGIVAVISLAVAVAVVALVSFAIVGLSARSRGTVGGPDDGAEPSLSPAAGTAVAGVCLLAVAAIVVYGLYVIVA